MEKALIKTLTIFGTRPEAIKMAPLIKVLEVSSEFENVVCVTAQHREMLDQVLNVFEIRPDIDLDLMRENQDLYGLTADVLTCVRDVLKNVVPDLVLVQGDTTTAFASTLAAFYAGIPVGHVEAGLRTGNLRAPFPEEANRVIISRLASLHFCPTSKNAQDLIKEGIQSLSIWVTGNTVIDALLWMTGKLDLFGEHITKYITPRISDLVRNNKPIILVTAHRRENFGKGFEDICLSLKQLAIEHTEWHFVYPVHMNPNVQGPVKRQLTDLPNVHLIQPLDYAPFVYLMSNSKLILTDSGGIQEEAPSLGKPVILMRNTTERQEAVEAGTVVLVGTDPSAIIYTVEKLMTDEKEYQKIATKKNPYGDGHSARQIVQCILDWWKKGH